MPDYPILQTERLLLRRLELSDAPVATMLLQERDISNNTLSVPFPYTEAMAVEWITHVHESTDGSYTFAVVKRSDEQYMGVISLHPREEHQHAVLGYWFGKPFWGQGYATEAAICLIKFGFEELKLNRIYAECYPHNIGSARVMQKAGMTYEGTLRQHVFHRNSGEFRDSHQYGILRSEYENMITDTQKTKRKK